MVINMVVNKTHGDTHVKFVSYTGKYPNLCSGILTLEIDGREYRFGHSIYKEPQGQFARFWSSGGAVIANKDFDFDVQTDEWVIDANDIPIQFREYVDEIDMVFNENVPYGCCGGCI